MTAAQIDDVDGRDPGRTAHLFAVAVITAAILAIFARDLGAMASQWWNASTYQHCLFILPLTAWLMWERRAALANATPAAWFPGLVAVAAATMLWIVGEAAGTALLRHAAIVFLVQAAVLTILGPGMVRVLLFPLFYLVFLIPFGDEFVPPLQILTAKMAMALLGIAGVPAHLDGVFITTPHGWFEVAEACSGVKFLVAMVAYGALVANVCFRSRSRRAAFMALCVAAPVIANGVRAFATIYAAEWTGAEAAGGFDHIVYGWFFFAFVMALVMAIGRPFFDRRAGEHSAAGTPVVVRGAPPIVAAAAVMGVTLLGPVWAATAGAAGRAALPHAVAVPETAGWTQVLPQGVPWIARFDGADHRLYARFRDARGREVDFAVALYGWQEEGRKIGGYGQGAADPDGAWRRAAAAPAPEGCTGDRLLGPGGVARLAWTCRTVGGSAVAGAFALRLRTLTARLSGGDQRAGVLILSAVEPGAARAMGDFSAATGPPETVLARLFFTAAG